MNTSKRLVACVLLLVSGLIAGCGGGGGDVPSQPVATFNVDAGITNLFAQGGTFRISGKGADYDLQATEIFTPGSSADPQFAGFLATQRAMTRTGSQPQTATGTYYYTTTPFRLGGRAFRTGATYLYTRNGDLPAAAAVGASGTFATGAVAESTSLEQVSWSLETSDTAGTAWACLNFTARNSFEALCARIDAQGRVLGLRIREQIALGPVIDLR